jgi:thymidylate synthase
MFLISKLRSSSSSSSLSLSSPRQSSSSASLFVAAKKNNNKDDFEVYRGELGYLRLMRRIMERGSIEQNRTGTPTRSLFAGQLSFDLSENTLPLLTTKHVSFYNVAQELLWFMSGSTNQKDLENKKVRIWRDNSSPEYLERVGLKRYAAFEDLGPIYSHQWRHFGAPYVDSKTNYTGQVSCRRRRRRRFSLHSFSSLSLILNFFQGVDQLQRVLNDLRYSPSSRRIMLVSWNPSQLDEMVLPPCHCLAQFRILNDTELHCHVYQRSADFALGVPYNIASYATLTHILAKFSGKYAKSLTFSYGDMHVYEPHWDTVYAQMDNKIYSFPKLTINVPEYLNACDYMTGDLSVLKYQHLKVENYRHNNKIIYKMIP